jgi:minor histocompatibility antigen H13
MKLLFPQPPRPDEDPNAVSLAILGLGNIAVPGIMIGLALRYDLRIYSFTINAKPFKKLKPRAIVVSLPWSLPQYHTATGGWGERFWA